MNKRTALVTLLENSFWITDEAKIAVYKKINTLTDDQVMTLGKSLAAVQDYMISHKEEIIKNSETLINSIKDEAQNMKISE
jgi:hypothetical protein